MARKSPLRCPLSHPVPAPSWGEESPWKSPGEGSSVARKDSVTLGWGGARAHAHVCIQGTGAPDPAGGGGGQWGQTATPADPAVEQVGPWGIGKGLHRLAEAQPSALPAVAPAPGLGDKLHPHLGLVQRTQEERGAVSPPSSTGSQGPASQPGVEGLAESQAPGAPGDRGLGAAGVPRSPLPPPRKLAAPSGACAWRGALACGDPGPQAWGSGGSASPRSGVGLRAAPLCAGLPSSGSRRTDHSHARPPLTSPVRRWPFCVQDP